MKSAFYLTALVLLIVSCTDYHQTGRQAAEDAIGIVKNNNGDPAAIVRGLDSIEKIYHEYKLETDFELGFEEAIEQIVNSGFKYEVTMNRFDTELNGNLPVIYQLGESHVFSVCSGITVPELAVNFVLHRDSEDYWEGYDEYEGSMTLKFDDATSRDYEFSIHDLKGLAKLETQDKLHLSLSYRNIIGCITDTPLDDLISTFRELNNIRGVGMNFNGKISDEEGRPTIAGASASDRRMTRTWTRPWQTMTAL